MDTCVKKSPFKSTEQLKQKLKDYKNGKSIGFTYVSSLKAMGLIKRTDGTKKISKKYLECMGKRIPKKLGGPHPKNHSNLYTNENPSNTIPIKFTTVKNVVDTIKHLERLRKSGRYTYTRIMRVAQVLEQRTRFMSGKKIHNEKAKEYLKQLKETRKV